MHELQVVLRDLRSRAKRRWNDPFIRIVIIMLLVLLFTSLIVHRFSPKSSSVECAFKIADTSKMPEIQGDAFRVRDCVELEMASTNSSRTLGLSGRKSMPADRGMLFDFNAPAEYCMWMKDMHFDLDMMWLNEKKEIIYMIEGVTPDTYPQSFCGPAEARYVVEVNAGVVKAADLRVKQRIRF